MRRPLLVGVVFVVALGVVLVPVRAASAPEAQETGVAVQSGDEPGAAAQGESAAPAEEPALQSAADEDAPQQDTATNTAAEAPHAERAANAAPAATEEGGVQKASTLTDSAAQAPEKKEDVQRQGTQQPAQQKDAQPERTQEQPAQEQKAQQHEVQQQEAQKQTQQQSGGAQETQRQPVPPQQGDARCATEGALRIAWVTIGDAQSTKNDAIALRNDDAQCIALTHYALRKIYRGTSRGKHVTKDVSIKRFGKDDVIASGATLIWARTSGRIRGDVRTGATLGADTRVVLRRDAQAVDAVSWGDAPEGGMTPNPTEDQYIAHTATHTSLRPQCANAHLATAPCPPRYDGRRVFINELLPNPAGDERAGEYIELYNPNPSAVRLQGWQLRDASATGRYTFPPESTIAPHGYHVMRRALFGFALNNGDETLTLLAPKDDELVVVDRVHYATAPESAALGRTSAGAQRWSKEPTPGRANRFAPPPRIVQVKHDRHIYKDVPAAFRTVAQGSGTLRYRWDFGDGHRSYRRETRHAYAHTGRYTLSVRVSDGTETVTHSETITVRHYPRSDALKVRAVAPNPVGKDAGAEYVLLQNTGPKTLHLKGWSIATGRTKDALVNHPLRKKVRLKPGATTRIRSDDAAIALPNTRGVVEVRRPDGSVAYRVRYRAPAGAKTVPEGAVYRKRAKRDGGGWVWDLSGVAQKKAAPRTPRKKTATTTTATTAAVRALIARAWENEFGAPRERAATTPTPQPTVLGVRTVQPTRLHRTLGALRTATNARIAALWQRIGTARTLLATATARFAPAADAAAEPTAQTPTIDPDAAATITPHPAVVALAITGLRPVETVFHHKTESNARW